MFKELFPSVEDNPLEENLSEAVPDIADQVNGLDRNDAMKNVIGPHLDQLIRPLYASSMTNDEIESFRAISPFKLETLSNLGSTSLRILNQRLAHSRVDTSDLAKLDNRRGDIFYHHHAPERIISEGLETGVTVPLTVASQIYRMEKGLGGDSAPVGYYDPIDPLDLIEIMERDSFDNILLRLSRGQNGFLGARSIHLYLEGLEFFAFTNPDESFLKIRDAYDMENGKVTGLSGAYAVAAEKRRKSQYGTHQMGAPFGFTGTTLSSGCPVRHRFEDPKTGNAQEPLLITAKNFLITGLMVVAAAQAEAERQEG